MPKSTLKYIFTLIINLCAFTAHAQTTQEDTTIYLVITPGIDIAQFAQPYINEGYGGLAVSVDVEYYPNIIFAGEFGLNSYNIEKDRYQYHSSGSFYKIGTDLNVLRDNRQRNQVMLGFRYAHARFEHELKELTVVSYWGENQTFLDPENIRSHWLEFTGGIRMELFNNLYIGWSLRARLKASNIGESYLPLYIPGYNKNRDNVTFGFTYSLYYKFFLPRKQPGY